MIEKFLNKIVKYYQLGEIVSKPHILTGGITNIVYKVITTKGMYIVKILRSNDTYNIEKSEKISYIAKMNNIKSLCALKINNKLVNNIENRNILVFEFYSGKVLLTKELTTSHIEKLAKELAKIHSIECNEKQENKYIKNDYN